MIHAISPATARALAQEADIAERLAPIVAPAAEAAARVPQPPAEALAAMAKANGDTLAAFCPLWLASEMR